MKFQIDFQPNGRRVEVEQGSTLLEAAQRAGVDILAACGSVGNCELCKVRVVSGEVNLPTESERQALSVAQIEAGLRLACQCIPQLANPNADPHSNPITVEIPPESLPQAQKMQLEGQETATILNPAVVGVDVVLSSPTSHDLRSDLTRLQEALDLTPGFPGGIKLETGPAVMNDVSVRLRQQNWQGRAVIDTDITGPGPKRLSAFLALKEELLGLAVDMGSTKLALYLVDLETGATLSSAGVMNPQIAYGEDVVSRIAFANKSESNRVLLQSRLVEAIQEKTAEMCRTIGLQTRQIVDAVLVGNTAMHHFFCGLPVQPLGAAPYIAAVSDPLDLPAADVGLRLSAGAHVHLPANIAGYVGADHTAALLSSGIVEDDGCRVLIDIGTNTEISLARHGELFSCSTASGPAFEGAHIRDGMRAAAGAIDRVHFEEGVVRCTTIGGVRPVGICGTGVLKAMAEMLRTGVLDWRGVFRSENHPYSSYVLRSGGKGEFLLAPGAQTGHGQDILITRRDVHEIQLAKGAIRTGIDVLLELAEIKAEQVDEWVIAGAFGAYLDLSSAVQTGMFPDVPLNRFRPIGNAAGMGAKQMLLSVKSRQRAGGLARISRYIELTVYPHFSDLFIDRMYFPSV